MEDKWENSTRMLVAKKILGELVDSLRSVPDLEIALRVFGHQSDKRQVNCQDTKLEIPFKPGNHDALINRIKSIDPRGTTLIAYTLKEAASDFKNYTKNSRNVIILLTDGIESCGGDPCALSYELQKNKVVLKPFIIGIGNEESWAKAFDCMGQYFNAASEKNFKELLNIIFAQTLLETTVKVKILNSNDEPKETNVNMTFVNSVTGEPVYDFVHYLDSRGEPDNLKVDPIITYDLVINTIPKVEKKNIGLLGGRENIITVKAPQGSLLIKDNYKDYKQLKAIIRQSNSPVTIHTQNAGITERYLTGTYEVEVLTLPRTVFKDVTIKQSQTITLEIDPPGVLNVMESISGYGSIYEIKPTGEQVLIYNCENDNSKINMAMQPGKYKFVFRSKKSDGSAYTDVQFFTIRSGATTNLKLFQKNQ